MNHRHQQPTSRSTPTGGDRTDGAIPESLVRERRIAAEVFDLADPLCGASGIELVHVEYQREPGGRVMRLYIDRRDGVTVDDCAQISREVGDVLDVHLGDIGPYRLEVSSPGPDRPLGRRDDFERFMGHLARIRLIRPKDGQRSFTGVLSGISRDTVRLAVNPHPGVVEIPFSEILRARLVNYMEKTQC
jgi:ribosome maturation factor RimP